MDWQVEYTTKYFEDFKDLCSGVWSPKRNIPIHHLVDNATSTPNIEIRVVVIYPQEDVRRFVPTYFNAKLWISTIEFTTRIQLLFNHYLVLKYLLRKKTDSQDLVINDV